MTALVRAGVEDQPGTTSTRDRPLPFLAGAMWSGFRLRCPRCRKGRISAGPIRLEERCAVCGYRFEFSEGDWSGAVMIAQMLMGLIAIPVWLALTLWTDLSFTATVGWTLVIVFALWIGTYRNVKGLWFGWLYGADVVETGKGKSDP